MTKHLGGRLKTQETVVKTQDEALGQNKASMSAKVLEYLDQRAPPGPVRLPEPCLARSGERGHRQKGRSRRAHSTQQRGPGPGGTCRGAWRGPQRRDRYLGTEHGGVRESAGREDGVPFREGRQRGSRAFSPHTRPNRSRSGEGGREKGRRAGGRGARGGGPARAAAPAPARKGSRAAAAGVGGGPAPVLAELTGGARFPVPPGVGDPGAVLAVTGGWRAAGPGRRRRRQGGEGDWRALALPRRPLLSVCVCSKMAARLVPRDTDAGPPPPTPPRPRLPLPPRSRTPTRPPGSPHPAALHPAAHSRTR
ncbi:translation initiation factor IF-2-like [Microtus oregoni]|uniref:translation initiation factor IF-2-like n=1 Tax=Microtus oregoni TaxID=111838 RepID=UPI001BB2688E|nr:translation initiation factor IF-2-like [Microtus oregoni]